MRTITGAEATLTVDEESRGGAITSIKWGGQEFVDSYHEVYGGRWSVLIDGGELSQTGVVVQANRVTTKRVSSGTVWVKQAPLPGVFPLPVADPTKASVLRQTDTLIEVSTQPVDFAAVAASVGELRVLMEMDVLGNPHIIRYRSQFFLDAPSGGTDVLTDGADQILGNVAANKLPHWANGAPLVHVRDEVSQNQYIIDMRPNTARDKTKEYEPVPLSGGPVVGKGDGTHNIGIYHRVKYAPPQLGVSAYVVRWREDKDISGHEWNELQILSTGQEGVPYSSAVRVDEKYIVVGSAQDVADAFRDLHNYFSTLAVSSAARMDSAVTTDPILL